MKKKICLNMIVKNERPVIERCLQSVKHLIDYWVIVDTGSTDSTQETIRSFFKDIPGELHERPWVDFATNRNEALFLAKDRGDYLLFIDADETAVFSSDFQMPVLEKDFYSCSYRHGNLENQRILLISTDLDWIWQGVLHEDLTVSLKTGGCFLKNVVINGTFTDGRRSQNPNKLLDDAKTLEAALLKEPDNGRYAFHLAGTYDNLEMPQEALKWYLKRTEMEGVFLETAFSWHRIGILQESLGLDPVESYCKAHSCRPLQREPLYRMANYFTYKKNSPFLGYLISKHSLSLSERGDSFFTESWIYDYGSLWQYSEFAYLIHRYKEALEGTISLLANRAVPQYIRESLLERKTILEKSIK